MATESKIVHTTDRNGNDISIEATIPVYARKSDRYWIAYSPHLKTFGYSKESKAKAVKDLDRALDLFFSIHLERGTLEKALLCFRWTKVNNTLKKPRLGNRPAFGRADKMEHRIQLTPAA